MNVTEGLASEQVLLHSALTGRDADLIWSRISPAMFTPGPYQNVAESLHSMWERGEDVDPLKIAQRMVQDWQSIPASGVTLPFIADLLSPTIFGDASFHVGLIVKREVARAVAAAATRALQAVESGSDPVDAATEASAALQQAAGMDVQVEVPYWEYDEVLGMAHAETPWVIRDTFAARERMVITGGEGMGKSTLLAQIALGASWGVHPFDTDVRFDPVDLLVLDVENSHEAQLAPIWRGLTTAYRKLNPDAEGAARRRLMKVRDIDLLNATERARFVKDVIRTRPGLVLMGSGYKLTGMTDDWKQSAKAIHTAVDRIRAATGASVMLEMHAGHGFNNDRNGMRPEGSSDWLKWPEFGFGMKTIDREKRVMEVAQWRGARVTGRRWPRGLKGGGTLPWVPIWQDEWDAVYAK